MKKLEVCFTDFFYVMDVTTLSLTFENICIYINTYTYVFI